MLVSKVVGDREAVDDLVCVLVIVFVDVPVFVWVGLSTIMDAELVKLAD